MPATERMTLDSLEAAANEARADANATQPDAMPGSPAQDPLTEAIKPGSQALDVLRGAIRDAGNFMGVGRELKKVGIKYHFSTESPMPPMYLVSLEGKKYGILNKKHATDPDFVVGDIAVGVMD